jgi:hypothetical protein
MSATRCRNCGAAVSGRYCGDCGQRVEPRLVPVWQLAREATANITHADSRLWRTLFALWFRPGFLTREYLDGRRARYLPPLRLYLVVSLLCFLLASMTGNDTLVVGANAELDPVTPDACNFVYQGPWAKQLEPRLRAACPKILGDNGRELRRRFSASLPGALFVALPVLALFMKILYWRPRRYYVEHLLFLVHYHSFLFTVVALVTAASLFSGNLVTTLLAVAVTLYSGWYAYRAMLNVYGQRRRPTILKFIALSVAYLAVGLTLLVLTLFYSVIVLSLEG